MLVLINGPFRYLRGPILTQSSFSFGRSAKEVLTAVGGWHSILNKLEYESRISIEAAGEISRISIGQEKVE